MLLVAATSRPTCTYGVICHRDLLRSVFVEKGHLDGCMVNYYPFWISEWHPKQSPSLPQPRNHPHPSCPSPSLQRILSRIGDMISPSALWLLRLQNSPVQALYMAKISCLAKPILRGKRLFCSGMTVLLTLQQMHYLHSSHTRTNLYKLEDKHSWRPLSLPLGRRSFLLQVVTTIAGMGTV